MDRIIILTDSGSAEGMLLTTAALEAAAQREDIQVAAVVLTDLPRAGRGWAKRLEAMIHRRGLDPSGPARLRRLARRHGFAVRRPPNHDINDPLFIERMRTELRPDIVFCFYCVQILGAPLLELCDQCVNYHNGSLPAYRGRRATCWSVYNGDDETGFAFHHMIAGIDEGNVLAFGSIPIYPSDTVLGLELHKAERGANGMLQLIEILASRDPGTLQSGPARYYAMRDARRLVRIDNPESLTSSELTRRLRAFGRLRLIIGGETYWVTVLEVKESDKGDGALAFRSSDGMLLRPMRIRHLSPRTYFCMRAVTRMIGLR